MNTVDDLLNISVLLKVHEREATRIWNDIHDYISSEEREDLAEAIRHIKVANNYIQSVARLLEDEAS